MKTLPYIFWAVAGFLVGGCSQQTPEYVLVYRPEIRQEASASARPGLLAQARVAEDPYTIALVESYNLNTRRQFTADSPYISTGEVVEYELRYVDRHTNMHHHSGRRGRAAGHHGGGNLQRTFRLRRTGSMVR